MTEDKLMMPPKWMRLKWIALLFVGLPAARASTQTPVPATGPDNSSAVRVQAPTTGSDRENSGHASVLKTQRDKTSYATGIDLARKFRRQGVDLDTTFLLQGFKDGFSVAAPLMTDDEIQKALSLFQVEMKQRQVRAKTITAQVVRANKNEGSAFLAANKKKEGVVTRPSGLQYKVIETRDGRKPTETDTVVFNYRGTFINGAEFDSSSRTGQPATLKLSDPKLMPGLKEALKLMPVGSKWQLFIPPELAYGRQGSGTAIGPNATLIFELELLTAK